MRNLPTELVGNLVFSKLDGKLVLPSPIIDVKSRYMNKPSQPAVLAALFIQEVADDFSLTADKAINTTRADAQFGKTLAANYVERYASVDDGDPEEQTRDHFISVGQAVVAATRNGELPPSYQAARISRILAHALNDLGGGDGFADDLIAQLVAVHSAMTAYVDVLTTKLAVKS